MSKGKKSKSEKKGKWKKVKKVLIGVIIFGVSVPFIIGVFSNLTSHSIIKEIERGRENNHYNFEILVYNIQVPANVYWYNTNIEVKKYDKLKINASGKWFSGIGVNGTGPDGEGGFFGIGKSACGECPIVQGNLGELIGKINNIVFRIGKLINYEVSQDGILMLSMNENTGLCDKKTIGSCYNDNIGSLDVEIEIKRVK